MMLLGVAALLLTVAAPAGAASNCPTNEELARLMAVTDSLLASAGADSAITLCENILSGIEGDGIPADTVRATLLDRMASAYDDKGLPDVVDSLYALARDYWVAQFGEISLQNARSQFLLGNAALKLGRQQQARTRLERCLDLYRLAAGPADTIPVTALNNLVYLHLHQFGDDERGFRLYDSATAVIRAARGEDTACLAPFFLFKAEWLLLSEGPTAEAESLITLSIALTADSTSAPSSFHLRALDDLALLYTQHQRYAEATEVLKTHLDKTTQRYGPRSMQVASALAAKADILTTCGRYTESLELLKRAVSIAGEYPNDGWKQIPILEKYAQALFETGAYEDAVDVLNRLEEYLDRVNAPYDWRMYRLQMLAMIRREQKRYDETVELYARLMDLINRQKSVSCTVRAQALMFFGSACFDVGRTRLADSLFERAREVAEGCPTANVTINLSQIADDYRQMGRYDDAEILWDSVLTQHLAARAGSPDLAVDYISLAAVYACTDRPVRATDYFRRALETRQEFIGDVCSYVALEQKLAYLNRYKLIVEPVYSLALQSGLPAAAEVAWDMTLRGKTVTVDMVAAEKRTLACESDRRITGLTKRHQAVCSELAGALIAGGRGPGGRQEEFISRLESEKDSIETILSEYCSRFGAAARALHVSHDDVIDRLPDSSALWEFILYRPYDFDTPGRDDDRFGDLHYLGFAVTPDGAIALCDLGPAAEIDSLVTAARTLLYRAPGDILLGRGLAAENELRDVTSRLTDRVVRPLVAAAPGTHRIYVSPDGLLNVLPFEILPLDNDTYLIEEFTVSYLSSGRDLLLPPVRHAPDPVAVIVADPDYDASPEYDSLATTASLGYDTLFSHRARESMLRGAVDCLETSFGRLAHSRFEADAVERFLRADGRLDVLPFYHRAATEKRFKEVPPATRIIHVATHGYFCERPRSRNTWENPLLRSGLVLAGANRTLNGGEADPGAGEDGILTAFEAASLNLTGTDLLVLSACESGLGEIVGGHGIYGLRRAFQQAGVRTMLTAMWPVPDNETATLMTSFYHHWLDGFTKLDALRAAALELLRVAREQDGHGHPLLWGGFTLLGAPE